MNLLTIFLFLVGILILNLFVTYELYRSSIEDSSQKIRNIKEKLEILRHELNALSLCLDSKIEKIISDKNSERRRKRISVKKKLDEKECKKNTK